MISFGELAALQNALRSLTPKNAQTLLKLVDVNVLKILDENTYEVRVDHKNLVAQTPQRLRVGERYLARLDTASKIPTLSHLVKVPKIFESMHFLRDSPVVDDLDKTLKILQNKTALTNFKETLLQEIAHSASKEHFDASSYLLLSLHQNVLSLPFYFYRRLGFLQIKKRYNKKAKRSFVAFYAFFQDLGAVSGTVSTQLVALNVVDAAIARKLEQNAHALSYPLEIRIVESIRPLYDVAINANILDIST